MEVSALVLSIIELAPLVQSCLSLYNAILGIRRAEGDLYTLQLKLALERRAFKHVIWCLEEAAKVEEGRNPAATAPTTAPATVETSVRQPPRPTPSGGEGDELVALLLRQIEAQLRAIDVTVHKYTQSAPDDGHGSGRIEPGAPATMPRSAKLTLGRKVVWVASDRSRLATCFDSLHYFTDGLERLVTSAAARAGNEFRQRIAAIDTADAAKLEIVVGAWKGGDRADVAIAARARAFFLRQQQLVGFLTLARLALGKRRRS